jgi:2-polyprenyl-3-methyl-5-hydroxy-6-metoxy-1,4-benzoquinol methylase
MQNRELKEQDIRPEAIFNEYLALAKIDGQTYFPFHNREEIVCPGCEKMGEVAFEKNGFIYDECQSCHTLFVNPRPLASDFSRYYMESPSSKFWVTTFYKETAEARREKLWKPKAELIKSITQRYCATEQTVVDIGGGYGIFAEVMRELTSQPVVVIEPSPSMVETCQKKGLNVVAKFLEDVSANDLPVTPKLFVSFELFEHLHNPAYFLAHLYNLMSIGDMFIFTTLSSAGVDIRSLWQDSKAVFPPHHLNFFNPSSIRVLLERQQFKVLEVTTPGKLDIDILCNNKELIKDRFWQIFVDQADSDQRSKMQTLLSENGFSSHMMVVCCKTS